MPFRYTLTEPLDALIQGIKTMQREGEDMHIWHKSLRIENNTLYFNRSGWDKSPFHHRCGSGQGMYQIYYNTAPEAELSSAVFKEVIPLPQDTKILEFYITPFEQTTQPFFQKHHSITL